MTEIALNTPGAVVDHETDTVSIVEISTDMTLVCRNSFVRFMVYDKPSSDHGLLRS